MDERIVELARRYRPLAVEMLKEAVRIPAEHIDLPEEEGGDPLCGISNHEGPRLRRLRERILECGAVTHPEHVGFDAFGNLVWTVQDPDDGIPPEEKVVVWMDGHTDTVQALRSRWTEVFDGGIDCYHGLQDRAKVDAEYLFSELGHLPPENEWEHLLFGRGSADQLGGVVCQILASRILNELRDQGSLRGVIVVGIGSVAEEDNDGGGPGWKMRHEIPALGPAAVPDVVILTEGTGDREKGALGLYRGQRGRMQIEVEVIGKSCHGSMPWEGRNPLEYGAEILAEAANRYAHGKGFARDEFLGPGTRTASWARLDTPSDCAVPERFVFRLDRRLTAGEDPQAALRDIEELASVARTRDEGLTVHVRVPLYEHPTWTGARTGNPQIYPGWKTPEEHPAIACAVRTYRQVCSPLIGEGGSGGAPRKEPRVARWIFSTDGVGLVLRKESEGPQVPRAKRWIAEGAYHHPAILGIGPGIEQNTHKIGECVDTRELDPVIAFLARFPSLYRDMRL